MYNKNRDDIPSGCNERINIEFYRWVWNYPKRSRFNTLKLLNDFSGKIYHLKSSREIRSLL